MTASLRYFGISELLHDLSVLIHTVLDHHLGRHGLIDWILGSGIRFQAKDRLPNKVLTSLSHCQSQSAKTNEPSSFYSYNLLKLSVKADSWLSLNSPAIPSSDLSIRFPPSQIIQNSNVLNIIAKSPAGTPV